MPKHRPPSCNMEGTSIPLGYSVSQSVGHPYHPLQNYGAAWLNSFCLWRGNKRNKCTLGFLSSVRIEGLQDCLAEKLLKNAGPYPRMTKLFFVGMWCANQILKAQYSPAHVGFLGLTKRPKSHHFLCIPESQADKYQPNFLYQLSPPGPGEVLALPGTFLDDISINSFLSNSTQYLNHSRRMKMYSVLSFPPIRCEALSSWQRAQCIYSQQNIYSQNQYKKYLLYNGRTWVQTPALSFTGCDKVNCENTNMTWYTRKCFSCCQLPTVVSCFSYCYLLFL